MSMKCFWPCAALLALAVAALAGPSLPRRLRLLAWLLAVALLFPAAHALTATPADGAPQAEPPATKDPEQPSPERSGGPTLELKPSMRHSLMERWEFAPIAWRIGGDTTLDGARLSMTDFTASRHLKDIHQEITKGLKKIRERHGPGVADFVEWNIQSGVRRANTLAQGGVLQKFDAIDQLLDVLTEIEFVLNKSK